VLNVIRRTAARVLPLPVSNWLRDRDHFDEVAMVSKLCRGIRNGVMVDVGAHTGSATGRFVELGWRVIAYEPDAKNRAEFLRRMSRYPGVELSSSAVSDKESDSTPFYSSDVSTGISGLHAFHPSHVAAQTVSTVTLAADLERRKVDRVDMIKVDVEGFDFFVLKGMNWALKPRYVVYEFEDRKTQPLGYTLPDSAKFMQDQGYSLLYSVWEPITEYGAHHAWRGLFETPPADIGSCWGNMVCFANESDRQACLAANARSVRHA